MAKNEKRLKESKTKRSVNIGALLGRLWWFCTDDFFNDFCNYSSSTLGLRVARSNHAMIAVYVVLIGYSAKTYELPLLMSAYLMTLENSWDKEKLMECRFIFNNKNSLLASCRTQGWQSWHSILTWHYFSHGRRIFPSMLREVCFEISWRSSSHP